MKGEDLSPLGAEKVDEEFELGMGGVYLNLIEATLNKATANIPA